MSKPKRVGVLTGGGDAPGLNPAIKGLVYRVRNLALKSSACSMAGEVCWILCPTSYHSIASPGIVGIETAELSSARRAQIQRHSRGKHQDRSRWGGCLPLVAEAVADRQLGKMVSARGIAPAGELFLGDISKVSGNHRTLTSIVITIQTAIICKASV